MEDIPHVINPEPGCRFRRRCPPAVDECHRVTPPRRLLGADHDAACHVAWPRPDPGFTGTEPVGAPQSR